MKNVNLTFTIQELNKLVNDEYSCVKLVKGGTKHVALHPYYLNDFNSGARRTLDLKLTKLDGIILYYKNPKLVLDAGGINSESFDIHLDIHADFYLFCPVVGRKLRAIVNKKSSDHVGCLVHKIFNVSIPRPSDDNDNESYCNWPGRYVKIGQEIIINITFTSFDYMIPHIRAEFDPDENYGDCIEEDSGISTCEDLRNINLPQTFTANVLSSPKNAEENDLNDDEEQECNPETEKSLKVKKRKRGTDDADLQTPKKKKKIKSDQSDGKKKKLKNKETDENERIEETDLSFSEIYSADTFKENSLTKTPKKSHKDRLYDKIEQNVENNGYSEMFINFPDLEQTSQSKTPKKARKDRSLKKNIADNDYVEESAVNRSPKKSKKEKKVEIDLTDDLKHGTLTKSKKKSDDYLSLSKNEEVVQLSDEAEISEDELVLNNIMFSKQSSPKKSKKNNSFDSSAKKSVSEHSKTIKDTSFESTKSEKIRRLSSCLSTEEQTIEYEDDCFDRECNKKIFVKVPRTPKKKQMDENAAEIDTPVTILNNATSSCKKKSKLDDYFIKMTKSSNLFSSIHGEKSESSEMESKRIRDELDTDDTYDREKRIANSLTTARICPENSENRVSFGDNTENISNSSDMAGSSKRKKSKKHKHDVEDEILNDEIKRIFHDEKSLTPVKDSENVDEFCQFIESTKRKKAKKHKKDRESNVTRDSLPDVETLTGEFWKALEENTSYNEETSAKKKNKAKKHLKDTVIDDVDSLKNTRKSNEFNESSNYLSDLSRSNVDNSAINMSDVSFKKEKKKKKRSKHDLDKKEKPEIIDEREAEKQTEPTQRFNVDNSIDASSNLVELNDSKKKKRNKAKNNEISIETSENNLTSTKLFVNNKHLSTFKIDSDDSDEDLREIIERSLANAIEESPKKSSKKTAKRMSDQSKAFKKQDDEEIKSRSPKVAKKDTKQPASLNNSRSNDDAVPNDLDDDVELASKDLDDIRKMLLASVKKSMKKKPKKIENNVNLKQKVKRTLFDEPVTSTASKVEESFDFGNPVTSTVKKQPKKPSIRSELAAFHEELLQKLKS